MKTKNFIKGALIGTLLAAGAAVVINKKVPSQTKVKTKKIITDLTATILERMRLLKRVTKINYDKVIEAVLDEYKTSKKLSDQTVKELRRDFKAQWKTINKELKGPVKLKTKATKRKIGKKKK